MRLRSALLAATVLAVPVAVKAQPVTGLYVGAGAGLNIVGDEYQKHSSPQGIAGKTQIFKPGYTGQIALGYGLGNGIRVEVEANYIDNNIHEAHGTPSAARSGGEQKAYGGFVNALYDFDLGLPFYPYVGAGIGYEETRWKDVHSYATNGSFSTLSSGTDGSVAAQAKLGVAVPIPGAPGLSVTAEYRFLDAFENQHFGGTATVAGKTAYGRNTITSDYNHSAIIGVRYAFGALPIMAPPTTPVAPQPAAIARTYLVFFDWDKYNLTDRARQIVAEAAAASTHVTYTRIEVNGYTDLSGTAQYNQGLSVRRAQTVAAELVRLGVPKTSIDIRGFGETHPLVPTAKGVREPQNRRVEIIIK
jgi:outer membrane protein OmpA-like peptidoglycan-associated protein